MWSSKKQPIVALLTTEAKYISATHATKEALWIRMFLSKITCPLVLPIMTRCNKSVILVMKNAQYHPRMKYINIHYHFIHNAVNQYLVQLAYTPTDEIAADILTNAVV